MRSWLKRSSLKQKDGRRTLLMPTAVGGNPILLLTLIGLFIAVGVFVVSRSYAASYFGQ